MYNSSVPSGNLDLNETLLYLLQVIKDHQEIEDINDYNIARLLSTFVLFFSFDDHYYTVEILDESLTILVQNIRRVNMTTFNTDFIENAKAVIYAMSIIAEKNNFTDIMENLKNLAILVGIQQTQNTQVNENPVIIEEGNVTMQSQSVNISLDSDINLLFTTYFNISFGPFYLSNSEILFNFRVVQILWSNNLYSKLFKNKNLGPQVYTLYVAHKNNTPFDMSNSSVTFSFKDINSYLTSENMQSDELSCTTFNSDTWDPSSCTSIIADDELFCNCAAYLSDFGFFKRDKIITSPSPFSIDQMWLIVAISCGSGFILITSLVVILIPTLRNAVMPYNRQRVKEIIAHQKKIIKKSSNVYTDTMGSQTDTEGSSARGRTIEALKLI